MGVAVGGLCLQTSTMDQGGFVGARSGWDDLHSSHPPMSHLQISAPPNLLCWGECRCFRDDSEGSGQGALQGTWGDTGSSQKVTLQALEL